MSCFNKLKKQANELELAAPLIEYTEKPGRMILRRPTKVMKESVEDGRKIKDSSESSSQPTTSADTSDQTKKESTGGNTKALIELEESHPRFGPLYGVDHPSVRAIKEKAWKHVLKHSSEKGSTEEQEQEQEQSFDQKKKKQEQEQSYIKEIYLKAIRKVEKEAKEIYADKDVTDTGSNFRWMMIKDGCFFLQLAFFILGCSEHLNYPSNDPIFGKKSNKKDVKKWIESMFFMGNQIPLVVLKELMAQKFFKDVIKNIFEDVINKGQWDLPPSGLCKKVLYEILVLPVLNLPKSRFSLKKRLVLLGRGSYVADHRQPCDLIHGLQNLLVGPAPQGHLSSDHYEADDDIDLEANEDDDYEAVDEDDDGTSENADRIRRFLDAVALSNGAIDKRRRIFPCATELKRAGISIKKLKNGGARSIDFSSYYFWAYLYLPVFPLVDENAEMIFENLLTYETNQQKRRTKREASAYLRFMSDVIQTNKDVKLLKSKGIIQGNSHYEEKLPGILSRLVSSEDIRLTQELLNLRRKISDYSSPWIHYKILANLVVILTVVQTFFALFAYFRPP